MNFQEEITFSVHDILTQDLHNFLQLHFTLSVLYCFNSVSIHSILVCHSDSHALLLCKGIHTECKEI